MSCLNPITITNPTKFLSTLYQQRMIMRVACGRCAACKDRIRNEWYYRALHEYKSCIKSNGYMLFDCLTYRESDVPRISNFYDVDKNFDGYCFDYKQVSDFMKSLRQQLVRSGYDVDKNLKFFAASEYGTKNTGTHRPHTHLLLFVYNSVVPPEVLSNLIAQKWRYGRTDGISYRGKRYFYDNCLIKSSLSSSIRVCKYVAKYVVKDSVYQKQIDKKINQLFMHLFAKFYYNDNSKFYRDVPFDKEFDWKTSASRVYKVRHKFDLSAFQEFENSPRGKRIRQSIERRLNQFHKQSQGFGVGAIDDIDMDRLERTGLVTCEDNGKPFMLLALPAYFKRKLFYEQVTVKGVRMWQPTKKGRIYLKRRELARIDIMKNEYKAANTNYNLGLSDQTIDDVVRYDMYYKGRIKGLYSYEPYGDDFNNIPNLVYSYITPADFQHYHMKFISLSFLGTSLTGYDDIRKKEVRECSDWIRKNVYFNKEYDDIIDSVSALNYQHKGERQNARSILEDELRYQLKEVGILQ